jgi:hypothetical protein
MTMDAIDKHGERLYVEVGNIVGLNQLLMYNLTEPDFMDMMSFMYQVNGGLYTRAMFKIALLANSAIV